MLIRKMLKNKKILITGGAGFLGLHLTKYFEEQGAILTLIDIAPYDPHEYSSKHKLIMCDVRNSKELDKHIKDQDYVIHAAAALPLSKKEDIFSTNIEGTRNVLTSSLKHNIKRVVYISSTAVYGIPKKHPIVESDPLVGVGPYGITKIESEKICRDFIRKGLNVTIIRPKTFLGTGRLGVFEILFDWIHDGKRIPVIGTGNNRYQLVAVDDLVYAVGLFLNKTGNNLNNAFSIGASKFVTVKKDLTDTFDYAKSGSKILPTPAFFVKKALYVFEKIGISPLYQWVYETADRDSFVSIDKLVKTLKWKPQYSNSQALIKAYKWYIANYKEIKSRKAGITHTVGWKQGVLGVFKKFM